MATQNTIENSYRPKEQNSSLELRQKLLLAVIGGLITIGAISTIEQPQPTENETPDLLPLIPAIVRECDAVLSLTDSMYFSTDGHLMPQDKIPVSTDGITVQSIGRVVFGSGSEITDAGCVTIEK